LSDIGPARSPTRSHKSAGNPPALKGAPAKARRDYHHGDLRRALIEGAVKTIARRGIGALNLRELAVRVGVTSGAPYHHFPSRERLLAAIADDGFHRLEAELVVARDAAAIRAGAGLEALGRAYVRFATAHPGYFRAMFHGEAQSSGPTEAGLRAFKLLRDAVLACQQEGVAPGGDPAPLVLTAWSAVHGFATLWVDGALPLEGMDPEVMAPDIGRTVSRMFSALARETAAAEHAIAASSPC
jgi:AcrR family transcriptional regulator